MSRFCASCGASIQSGATTCASCHSPVPLNSSETAATPGAAKGLTDNVAGMLAYVTFIPAIIFLVVAPYSKNSFVRFHSFQSIFFNVAWFVLWIFLSLIGHIPVFGWATLFLWPIVAILGFVLWLVMLLKTYQGQKFKLPVIGAISEQQAQQAS